MVFPKVHDLLDPEWDDSDISALEARAGEPIATEELVRASYDNGACTVGSLGGRYVEHGGPRAIRQAAERQRTTARMRPPKPPKPPFLPVDWMKAPPIRRFESAMERRNRLYRFFAYARRDAAYCGLKIDFSGLVTP